MPGVCGQVLISSLCEKVDFTRCGAISFFLCAQVAVTSNSAPAAQDQKPQLSTLKERAAEVVAMSTTLSSQEKSESSEPMIRRKKSLPPPLSLCLSLSLPLSFCPPIVSSPFSFV